MSSSYKVIIDGRYCISSGSLVIFSVLVVIWQTVLMLFLLLLLLLSDQFLRNGSQNFLFFLFFWVRAADNVYVVLFNIFWARNLLVVFGARKLIYHLNIIVFRFRQKVTWVIGVLWLQYLLSLLHNFHGDLSLTFLILLTLSKGCRMQEHEQINYI